MTSPSRARPRRSVPLRCSYNPKTGAFTLPGFVEIAPGESILNPLIDYLPGFERYRSKAPQADPAKLRVIDGGRSHD